MERLTERELYDGKVCYTKCAATNCPDKCSMCGIPEEAAAKLKEYEDLEEHGKLVLYPTYAYFIIDGNIHKGWVQEVVYSVCRKPLCDIRYDDNSLASYRGYVGNTVFLTKAEAEAAL